MNRLNQSKILYILFLAFFLGGCQTTPTRSGSSYNIFFTPSDHLKKTLDEKEYVEAEQIYTRELKFFEINREANKELIKRLFSHIDRRNEKRVLKTITSLGSTYDFPLEPSMWEEMKKLLEESSNILESYYNYISYESFSRHTDNLEKISLLRSELISQLNKSIGLAFVKFNHSSNSFFDLYPIYTSNEDKKNITLKYKDILLHSVKGMTKKQVEDFNSNFEVIFNSNPQYLTDFENKLGEIYYSKVYKELGFDLINYIKASNLVSENGFKTSSLIGKRLAIIDNSSQSLLNEGKLEFPIELDTGIFRSVKTSSLEKVLKMKNKYDYVIIFSTNVSKTTRRIKKRDRVKSKFISGQRKVPNRQYEQIKMELYQAQQNLSSISNQWCQGLTCIIKLAGVVNAENKLNELNQSFSQTAMMLTEDTFTQYDYSKSNLESRKIASTTYYFIDLRKGKIIKGYFDISESKRFVVPYQVNDRDINHWKIINKYDSEEDVEKFERSSVLVSLSQLIKQVHRKEGQFKKINLSYSELKKDILSDRYKAVRKYNLDSDKVVPRNDKRMDHVVVIYNPSGSLGTGFYVTPDLVLTNYHVVEGAKFMEIKAYNGSETFGKVVKTDVRLDLALIKVQQIGNPASFFSGSIPLGSTIEAIGHPKGLEFSITRGVVSAIREVQDAYGIGGKKVTFIQTDAALNSGNSGGPLFLNNKVIGVNNNKRVGEDVEGLAFSIHYHEVENFLKEDF